MNEWTNVFIEQLPGAIASFILGYIFAKIKTLKNWIKRLISRFRLKRLNRNLKTQYEDDIVVIESVSPCYENVNDGSTRSRNATMRMTDKKFIFDIPIDLRRKLESYQHDGKILFQTHPEEKLDGDNHELFDFLRNFYGFFFRSDAEIQKFIDEQIKKTVDYFIDRLEHSKLAFNNYQVGVNRIDSYRTDNNNKDLIEKPTLNIELYQTDYFTAQVMVHIYQQLRWLDARQSLTDGSYLSIFDNIGEKEVPTALLNKYFRPFMSSIGIGGYLLFDRGEGIEYWTVTRSSQVRNGSSEKIEKRSYSFDETIDLRDGELTAAGFVPDIYCAAYRALQEELGLYNKDKRLKLGDCKLTGLILIKTDDSEHKEGRFEIQLLGYSYVKLTKDLLYGDLVLKKKCAIDGNYEAIQVCPNKITQKLTSSATKYIYTPEALYYADVLRNMYNNEDIIL